jgi:hypothetical protein
MDNEQWRKRLLKATDAALERLRAPELVVQPDLIADLERLLADLEAQAQDGTAGSAGERCLG